MTEPVNCPVTGNGACGFGYCGDGRCYLRDYVVKSASQPRTTSTPSLPAQIGAVREAGWYWVRSAANIAGRVAPKPFYWDGKVWVLFGSPYGGTYNDSAWGEIGPRISDPVTLQQHERLEAEYARLSETAGEDYAVGVQAGMKLSGDHIERLEATLRHVEAVLSIVEPRSHKAEYLETLAEVRAALGTAAPDKPEDAERGRDG